VKKVEATHRERDEPQATKTTPKEKAARTRLSPRKPRLNVETRDEAKEEAITHTMTQFGSVKHLTAKAVKEEPEEGDEEVVVTNVCGYCY
jgi:hypothetical protein